MWGPPWWLREAHSDLEHWVSQVWRLVEARTRSLLCQRPASATASGVEAMLGRLQRADANGSSEAWLGEVPGCVCPCFKDP